MLAFSHVHTLDKLTTLGQQIHVNAWRTPCRGEKAAIEKILIEVEILGKVQKMIC